MTAAKSIGVVQSVRLALKPRARLATIIGFLIGGIVPVAIYVTAHNAGYQWQSPSGGLVVGGLVYSAQTVFQWARQAFGQALKSAGFVVLLEGVMVTSQVHWLALVVLGYLVAINGVAAGVNLALGPKR